MENVEVSKSLSKANLKPTMWRKLCLSFMSRFTEGRMTVVLPEGDKWSVGNGKGDYAAEMRVHDESFFKKMILEGDIGFAEAFMEGMWSSPDIGNIFRFAIDNVENSGLLSGSKGKTKVVNILSGINRVGHLLNRNGKSGSKTNIHEHYDLGNDFFSLFLDPTMTYSSAIFSEPNMTLEQAQHAKYESLCELADIKETDHVLEIGCGWGGFAEYAVKTRGCRVTGVTISKEQLEFAQARMEREGIADKVSIEFQDYRDLTGLYDKVVSIEMIEAVGDEFLPTYFQSISNVLKKDGVAAIQAILSPDSRYESFKNGVDFIQKHIFPGSLLPSVGRMVEAAREVSDLHLYSLKDMGQDYARTLNEWDKTFHKEEEKIMELCQSRVFWRKWEYYFKYCEVAFETRNISVGQFVFTRPNNQNYKK